MSSLSGVTYSWPQKGTHLASSTLGKLPERAQSARVHMRKTWHGWFAAFVTIAVFLASIDFLLVEEAGLHGLLIPSLSALAFNLFTRPAGSYATWRGFVFAPAIGAVVGLLGTIAQVTLPQYLVILVAVALAMIAMRLLGIANGSVLVIVLLPIVHGSLVGPDSASRHNPFPIYTYWYPVWILVYATVLFLMFKAWRHTLPLEERVEHRVEEAEERLDLRESPESRSETANAEAPGQPPQLK